MFKSDVIRIEVIIVENDVNINIAHTKELVTFLTLTAGRREPQKTDNSIAPILAL